MSRLRSRSIRFRLTAWYAAVLALALLLVVFATSEVLERRLSSTFDDDLLNTARAIQRTAEVRVMGDGFPVTIDLPALDPFSVAGYFIQISRPNGAIQYRSEALGSRDLPQTDLSQGLDQNRYDTVSIDGQELRIIHAPIRLAGEEQLLGVLSVASSTEQIERSIEQVRRVLLVVALVATIASIIGGWFLAGRALRPVERMRRDVAEIALDDASRISLTERVNDPGTNDEISRLAQTFNDLLARLEAAFDTERRFIADASHELRTPLTAIRGNIDVLMRQSVNASAVTPDQLDAMQDIQREAGRMGRLLDDLLTLARASAGEYEPILEQIDLVEPVQRAVRTARVFAPDREITFEADGSVKAIATADQIEQLVLILLDNAVRHSEPPSAIQVTLSIWESVAVLTVIDRGEGIAPEHLPHLFERFYRVDSARSRNDGGSGLGLAIAHAIVERSGGEISVASELGIGTTFSVHVPVTPGAAAIR